MDNKPTLTLIEGGEIALPGPTPKRPPRLHRGGKPATIIDLDELRRFCRLAPSVPEAAVFFGCTVQTMHRHLKDVRVAEVWAEGVAEGKTLVRRAQFRMLEKGDTKMIIHMSKHMLGQSDKLEIANKAGAQPIHIMIFKGDLKL